jgi:hypothetical protein
MKPSNKKSKLQIVIIITILSSAIIAGGAKQYLSKPKESPTVKKATSKSKPELSYDIIIDDYQNKVDKILEEFRQSTTTSPDKYINNYTNTHSNILQSSQDARSEIYTIYERLLSIKQEDIYNISTYLETHESLEPYKTGNTKLDKAIEEYKAKEDDFETQINNSNFMENLSFLYNLNTDKVDSPLSEAMKELSNKFTNSDIHPDSFVRYGIMMQAIADDKFNREISKIFTDQAKAIYSISLIQNKAIEKLKIIKEQN